MSTSTVAAETVERARSQDLQTRCLPNWYDVHTAEDLERLVAELRSQAQHQALHTGAFLSKELDRLQGHRGRLCRAVAPWLCEPPDVGDRAVFHRVRHICIPIELLKGVIVDLHDSLSWVFPGALIDGSLTQCLPKPRALRRLSRAVAVDS